MLLTFFAGPTVEAPIIEKPLPELEVALEELPAWVAAKNAAFPNIKADNESKLIFADSIPQQTDFAIVYLHGFSGSTADGAPVHVEVAKAMGANIYLPRLYAHGLATEEGLLEYSGEKSLDSAREALAVGKLLGKSYFNGYINGLYPRLSASSESILSWLLWFSTPRTYASIIHWIL